MWAGVAVLTLNRPERRNAFTMTLIHRWADLLEAADDAPIIRMLNALLTQAVRDGASDIHIEPYERSSSVRFRVDGTLREVVQPNRALHAALISRLKIMAELDIAEKRLPQDGRISLRVRPEVSQISAAGAVTIGVEWACAADAVAPATPSSASEWISSFMLCPFWVGCHAHATRGRATGTGRLRRDRRARGCRAPPAIHARSRVR